MRPHWKAHILDKLNLTVMPSNSRNLKLVNIQKAAKSHVWGDTCSGHPTSPLGETTSPPTTISLDTSVPHPNRPDLIRIPANSKTQMLQEEFDLEKKQTSFCEQWLANIGINRDLTKKHKIIKNAEPPAYIPSRSLQHHITHDPGLLINDLLRASTVKDATFTVEDKDPSILWQIMSDDIFNFWRHTMSEASDRWEIHDCPTADILQKYRGILDYVLPRNLLRSSNSFSTKHIPYTYFTVKHKCFRHCTQQVGGTLIPPVGTPPTPSDCKPHLPAHTCRKKGHSCLRNIVSFRHLPGRTAFRRVGRAFIHGLCSVMPGYGLRGLSRGKIIILSRLESQEKRREGSFYGCVQCGAAMSGPTLYTADAGQAYEMVAPARIEKSFCSIFKAIRRVTKKADPLISVIHSTKAKCKFGGFITDKLFDRSVFYLSRIEKSMRALVKCRWYRFGNSFIFQKSGIPIGGRYRVRFWTGFSPCKNQTLTSFCGQALLGCVEFRGIGRGG